MGNVDWNGIRKWVYLVLTAGVPLLILYGVVDEQSAPMWVALAAAALGFPLAAANTSKVRVVETPVVTPPGVEQEDDYAPQHSAEVSDYPDLDALSEPVDKTV